MWKWLFLLPLFVCAEVMPKNAKIYVAGHKGLVGSAIIRKLEREGYTNLVYRTSKELDLKDPAATLQFFEEEKPDYVFLAAAKVGGIGANWAHPAEFIRDNLLIELNVLHSAYLTRVKKLLFLGSSCIYPRDCPQPILESYLLTGPLEATNAPYALAKIAGIELCKSYNRQYQTNFISCMPTNLYGPNDNFDLASSHVLPALIAKFVTAKNENRPSVELWGTGKALREFLHADDLADATFLLMSEYTGDETINVGFGADITIFDVAQIIKEEVGYEGQIHFNSDKPDGTPKKLLNIDKIKSLGWQPKIPLREGLRATIQAYLQLRDHRP